MIVTPSAVHYEIKPQALCQNLQVGVIRPWLLPQIILVLAAMA